MSFLKRTAQVTAALISSLFSPDAVAQNPHQLPTSYHGVVMRPYGYGGYGTYGMRGVIISPPSQPKPKPKSYKSNDTADILADWLEEYMSDKDAEISVRGPVHIKDAGIDQIIDFFIPKQAYTINTPDGKKAYVLTNPIMIQFVGNDGDAVEIGHATKDRPDESRSYSKKTGYAYIMINLNKIRSDDQLRHEFDMKIAPLLTPALKTTPHDSYQMTIRDSGLLGSTEDMTSGSTRPKLTSDGTREKQKK